METIKWRDEWSLGNKRLDDQHICLISTINKVIIGKADVFNLLEKLIEYSSEHFAEEEQLMFEVGYPKNLYEAHKKEHKDFTNLLLETSFGLIKTNNPELASKLKEFCIDWFKYHFLSTDKRLADFLKGGANTENEPNK